MQPRIERQLRALHLAKSCAECGARVKTIGHLTGIPAREILRLLFPDRQAVPRGRSPDSPEWYHGANVIHRAEASIVVATYMRLRIGGIAPGEALVGAYQHYRRMGPPPHRISFDRAFDLAAHTEGLWLTRTQSFSLVNCPKCECDFLAAYGSIDLTNQHCPFCKLVQRYVHDSRVQAAYPVQQLVTPSSEDLGMMALWRHAAATHHRAQPPLGNPSPRASCAPPPHLSAS